MAPFLVSKVYTPREMTKERRTLVATLLLALLATYCSSSVAVDGDGDGDGDGDADGDGDGDGDADGDGDGDGDADGDGDLCETTNCPDGYQSVNIDGEARCLCDESQPCSECSEVLFFTGHGHGEHDSMTYWHYYADGTFVPAIDLEVHRIVPEVYFCNGPCSFEISISNGDDVTASGRSSGRTQEDLIIEMPVTLRAGETYEVSQHAWTEASIGIVTAGSTNPIVQCAGTFTLTDARSNSSDHFDRGPVAFSIVGCRD